MKRVRVTVLISWAAPFIPAFGFLQPGGWVSATVGFAAPVALASMAFGEYGKSVLPGALPLALAIGVVEGW